MRTITALTISLALCACIADTAAPPTTPDPAPAREPDAAISPAAASGIVGTPHPAFVQRVAPDGSWVLLCQARADTDGDGEIAIHRGYHGETFGDEMVPYLVRGGGEGERIDDFVGSDESGRWVLVRRGSELELVDVRAGTSTSLGALPEERSNPFAAHPGFDFAGAHLARIDPSGAIYVRELATGRETRIDPGPGLLVAIDLDPTAASLSAMVVTADTDGDGQLTAPAPRTSLAHAFACRGPPMSYSVFGRTGDDVERRIAAATGGTARAVQGMVATYGAAAIVRTDTGALVLADGSVESPLAPESCGAEVLLASRAAGSVLVHCRADGSVRLWREGALTSLGLTVPVSDQDPLRVAGASTFGVAVLHSPAVAIDLARGTLTRFDGSAIWVDGLRVAIRREGGTAIVDLESGAATPIDATGRAVGAQGRFLAVGERVADLSRAAIVGRYFGELSAVSSEGRVLVSEERDRGPYAWRAPMPIETTLEAWRAAGSTP
jgi:hypothetical protein